MDAQKRRPDHPEYNERTLYVPPDFYAKETEAMKQWWDLKSRNLDTVLFFKVSKHQYAIFYMSSIHAQTA
jgi:DNA mismatch repair protein MSH6